MPQVPRSLIKEVVRQCVECNSIDPEPVRVCPGSLNVPQVWRRLAIDVTHVENEQFLSIIDCGPSRFGIWRRLSSEEAGTVSHFVSYWKKMSSLYMQSLNVQEDQKVPVSFSICEPKTFQLIENSKFSEFLLFTHV